MKANLFKVENFWLIVIEREDGTRNDYRFVSKGTALKFARNCGLELN